MSELIKTQKVPLPKVRRTNVSGPPRRYPFETMKVKEMFFVPNRDRNTMAPYVSATGKALGRKFSTRLCFCRQLRDGTWEPCEEDAKGAVQGIGVWRIK